MPAFFHQYVQAAEGVECRCHDRRPVTLARHVVVDEEPRLTRIGADRLPRLVVDVADHDAGALGGEEPGRRRADAAGGTGDEGDFAGEPACAETYFCDAGTLPWVM
jgi:hypothetical protein